MKAICYRNTKTTLPGWIENLHENQPNGYAYETDSHFIHFYGQGNQLFTISPGLTVFEKKNGSLVDWVDKVFGAKEIYNMEKEVGHVNKGIWRPGLYNNDEILYALQCNEYEERSSEQALRILLEALDKLFLYIEPCKKNMGTYSHKIRELLILACMEVENQWLTFFKKPSASIQESRYTTNDYVKLCKKCFLNEFQVTFKNYHDVEPISPFREWENTNPTKSLTWYDAYNKTKHDRNISFSEAKLMHVLNAVSANIIMHCVRFGPYGLYNNGTTLSGCIHQMTDISLVTSNSKYYYIPLISLPVNAREDLSCYDSYRNKDNIAWITDELVL